MYNEITRKGNKLFFKKKTTIYILDSKPLQTNNNNKCRRLIIKSGHDS